MTVVCGFDGTPPSRNALAYALGQAERLDEQLVVVWVESPAAFAQMPVSTTPAEAERVVPTDTRETLDERLGDAWEFVALHGEAATELERIAVERRANVLIVGRSAHPALHVLGSVSGRLARRAKCPVVVVP